MPKKALVTDCLLAVYKNTNSFNLMMFVDGKFPTRTHQYIMVSRSVHSSVQGSLKLHLYNIIRLLKSVMQQKLLEYTVYNVI